MIGLILVATGGGRYTKFVEPLLQSAERYFPQHTSVLFTDNPLCTSRGIKIRQENLGWPRATLMRYHMMLKHEEILSRFDHLFYCDIDMIFTSKIEPDEILSSGITAVLHPGFPDAFERNPLSTACVTGAHTYYQGCLIGGTRDSFLKMCRVITHNIDVDDSRGVMALWHDESHLNRYLIDNPPAKVLSPAYCFPEPKYLKDPGKWMPLPIEQFVPKARHIEKIEQGSWKNV